ncbi:hypothetical protein AB0F15_31385 [Amycolatopsis sp. NPDC026612]|uniref:hypothetical protein n=1 Tax=Amycolatopsis sp. NPDC026612 TaxID=3155466 RepID=UPI003403F31C
MNAEVWGGVPTLADLAAGAHTRRPNHSVSAAGVVLGPPVRDACTGLESIPLASLGNGTTVWVPDRDVIGIEPRRAPAEPAGG